MAPQSELEVIQMKWTLIDSTCPKCNIAYRALAFRTNTHLPDFLVCPGCGWVIEVSTRYQYFEVEKIDYEPLDNSQIYAIIESRKR